MKKIIIFFIIGIFLSNGLLQAQNKSLTKNEKELLEKVKLIRVVIEQSYGEAKVVLPIYDIFKKILQGANFRVVKRGAKHFDITLKLKIEGETWQSSYRSGNKNIKLYAHVNIRGNLDILDGQSVLYSKKIFKPYRSPRIITDSRLRPEDAPFSDAFYDVLPLICEAIYNLWGIEPLIDSLEANDDWYIRVGIIKTLQKIKDSRAVEPLIASLEDKNWKVKADAARALGIIEDSRAVEPLIAALKDESGLIRSRAAQALGIIEDSRAVEPLIAALKDEYDEARLHSNSALCRICRINDIGFCRDRKNLHEKWQKWLEENKEKCQKTDN